MAEQKVMQKLDEIKAELDEIKKNMAHVDYVLTDDDKEALDTAEEDFSNNKTRRL